MGGWGRGRTVWKGRVRWGEEPEQGQGRTGRKRKKKKERRRKKNKKNCEKKRRKRRKKREQKKKKKRVEICFECHSHWYCL